MPGLQQVDLYRSVSALCTGTWEWTVKGFVNKILNSKIIPGASIKRSSSAKSSLKNNQFARKLEIEDNYMYIFTNKIL